MATALTKEALIRRLAANLTAVRDRIGAACGRAGRVAAGVRLVAVTKYVSPDVIESLIAAGATDLGESRVQQLADRAARLAQAAPTWHMIGHLQRNKIRQLLPHCRMLHSLDSVRLAEELSQHACRAGVTVSAYLEINVSGEGSKGGFSLADAAAGAASIQRLPGLRVAGLMTMAPLADDPELSRPHFARLRALLDDFRRRGAVDSDCHGLSMGMSQDYEVAIEEGATAVRVGSALFEGLDATTEQPG